MEIEFTKKTIKLVEKKLRVALKVGNPGQIQKVCAILMLAHQIAPESVCQLFEITLRTLYN